MPAIRQLGFDAFSFEERIKGVEMDVAEVRRLVGRITAFLVTSMPISS